ncbi:MAG: alkaline phosphatase D family protein [Gammaproteobacteria bacterium]|nr:alkaline phosphatase D family protein [Gammaproteobacteria bacterium]
MRIAFASCAKIQKRPRQPAWKRIEKARPDLLLLLGDNVYGGTLSLSWKQYHKKLDKRYRQQFAEKHFKHLVARVPLHATWDDHDFAKGNDVKGAEVKVRHKDRSRALFHRHMHCSTNLPEVYHAFTLGDVKFIMLDGRYYREPTAPSASILGAEQERWLERELQHEQRYTVVCSGSCLTKGGERWERYAQYYSRFLDLARDSRRLLFLAGDIHKNRLVAHDGFFELISSGVGRGKRDNYGIVDFADDHVRIRLRGNRAKDNLDTVIDAATWRLRAAP